MEAGLEKTAAWKPKAGRRGLEGESSTPQNALIPYNTGVYVHTTVIQTIYHYSIKRK